MLLFDHPAGWLLINIIVPMKAMSEYAHIHEKILKYVLKRDDKPLEEKYEKMFN
jgi:hypothetical protein